mmetsp:Transcript_99616/g.160624  ORF Transcript_99616/g.160624 Transcript_99616/m.160624 type:complete len:395 (+) Transcript_99616:926-2110(+)
MCAVLTHRQLLKFVNLFQCRDLCLRLGRQSSQLPRAGIHHFSPPTALQSSHSHLLVVCAEFLVTQICLVHQHGQRCLLLRGETVLTQHVAPLGALKHEGSDVIDIERDVALLVAVPVVRHVNIRVSAWSRAVADAVRGVSCVSSYLCRAPWMRRALGRCRSVLPFLALEHHLPLLQLPETRHVHGGRQGAEARGLARAHHGEGMRARERGKTSRLTVRSLLRAELRGSHGAERRHRAGRLEEAVGVAGEGIVRGRVRSVVLGSVVHIVLKPDHLLAVALTQPRMPLAPARGRGTVIHAGRLCAVDAQLRLLRPGVGVNNDTVGAIEIPTNTHARHFVRDRHLGPRALAEKEALALPQRGRKRQAACQLLHLVRFEKTVVITSPGVVGRRVFVRP